MNRQELINQLDRESHPSSDRIYENLPEDPDFWWKLVNLNPALLRGLVIGTGALLATFGLVLGDEKQGAIITAVTAILAVVQALWTRRAVTPNIKVVVYKPDPVALPDVVAPGPAVMTDIVQVANAAADIPEGNFADLPFPERVGSV